MKVEGCECERRHLAASWRCFGGGNYNGVKFQLQERLCFDRLRTLRGSTDISKVLKMTDRRRLLSSHSVRVLYCSRNHSKRICSQNTGRTQRLHFLSLLTPSAAAVARPSPIDGGTPQFVLSTPTSNQLAIIVCPCQLEPRPLPLIRDEAVGQVSYVLVK